MSESRQYYYRATDGRHWHDVGTGPFPTMAANAQYFPGVSPPVTVQWRASEQPAKAEAFIPVIEDPEMLSNAVAVHTPQPSDPADARKFRGVGELERSGYIPAGSATERDAVTLAAAAKRVIQWYASENGEEDGFVPNAPMRALMDALATPAHAQRQEGEHDNHCGANNAIVGDCTCGATHPQAPSVDAAAVLDLLHEAWRERDDESGKLMWVMEDADMQKLRALATQGAKQ